MTYDLHSQIAQLLSQLKLPGHQASDSVVGPLCHLLIHEGMITLHSTHLLGDGSSSFENCRLISSSHGTLQASCHYCITWSRHGAPQDCLRLLEVKKGFSGGSEDDHVTPASWRHVRLEAREVECKKKQENVLGTCTRGQGVGHKNLW